MHDFIINPLAHHRLPILYIKNWKNQGELYNSSLCNTTDCILYLEKRLSTSFIRTIDNGCFRKQIEIFGFKNLNFVKIDSFKRMMVFSVSTLPEDFYILRNPVTIGFADYLRQRLLWLRIFVF